MVLKDATGSSHATGSPPVVFSAVRHAGGKVPWPFPPACYPLTPCPPTYALASSYGMEKSNCKMNRTADLVSITALTGNEFQKTSWTQRHKISCYVSIGSLNSLRFQLTTDLISPSVSSFSLFSIFFRSLLFSLLYRDAESVSGNWPLHEPLSFNIYIFSDKAEKTFSNFYFARHRADLSNNISFGMYLFIAPFYLFIESFKAQC